MAHFRETSVKEHPQHVSQCWNLCLEESLQLPMNEIRMQDSTGCVTGEEIMFSGQYQDNN